MDKPDTIIELHRTIVEKLAMADFPPAANPPAPFQASFAEGQAFINIALSRVWFYQDGSGRTWSETVGTSDSDRERHFAFDLRLADHPVDTGLADSRLELTTVLGLPAPTVPPTICRGKSIPANVIPILGRLTIHERLDRIDSTVDGRSGQNIVIDFGPQASPTLEATAPTTGIDARLFGPGVQRRGDGSATIAGNDPRIVWELTREEQLCILQSTAGKLLVSQKVLGGASQTQAEDEVLETIAAGLADGVANKLTSAGNAGTSVKSILPDKDDLPADQVGVLIGPECTTGTDAIEIDGRVRAWTRVPNGEPGESLQFQLRTAEDLPDEHRLPDSILALRDVERIAFSRAGWAILRSLRCGQLKALCLDTDDFDAAEGCRLRHGVGITVGEHDATLTRFVASIIPWSQRPDQGLLHIEGRAEGGDWRADWWIEFELDFSLERGEVPRDALPSETPERTMLLEDIDARIDEIYAERCAGTIGTEEADAEVEALLDQKKLGPRTIGVKPIERNTVQSSDASPTVAGIIAGVLIGSVIAIVSGGLAFEFSAAVIFSFFVVGVVVGLGGIALLEAFVADPMVADALAEFVNKKRNQPGDQLPLDGFEPIDVQLALVEGSQDAYALNAYFEEIAPRMRISWRQPDTPKPAGDPDYVIQWVAGTMPNDQRIWMLTVYDAVRYITAARLALTVGPADAPVHVATSRRGRRYLRTNRDAGVGNNLAKLPALPT